ncbi:MAG: hypothetical protein WBN01_02660, partial [Polyangiales bacterium]
MWKAMIIIALAAIGCGDADSTPRLAPGGGFGGEGGTGGMAGFGGAGGFGGEGGAGGVAVTTEEFRVPVPNFLEYFGGMDFPTWPALVSDGDLVYFVAPWHVVRREPPSADEMYPDRVEVCTRIDYVDREVSRVVGACFETDFEIVAAGGDGGISVVVGTPPTSPEFWAYTELRLYYGE